MDKDMTYHPNQTSLAVMMGGGLLADARTNFSKKKPLI